ncbi:hypothetical protein P170DRAFT_409866 [Aspergillus steynii IBT 23096]|uniref:RGS domain-containing protein n=1 Tax=Aspergillus steynii IBT 23096 TaxID=1392250 RepID=A0A2I2G457_9EURO|nr:uncharacterized protein P170DRAFT_409866 [Aspergillus steynii IBT 23096]PLB47643.1 hypothetical protein P170DRAFT_409866 [Aspergillus steynii IBT 23096]
MGSELGITPDSKPQAVYSPVSIWWAVWAGVWTIAVSLGMAYLIVNRHSPVLRIRGIALSLSAIVLLHLYFASVQFGVMVGPLMPGDVQFWIMGTYLPCGIALFHASNTRFLHVAKLQKKYASHDSRASVDSPPQLEKGKGKQGLLGKFFSLDYTIRIMIVVGIMMLTQIFLLILMWLISRKFHSSWGIPGTEVTGTPMEQTTEQGRGWEWWPSVLWQFIWAWIVAPYILWKSRNIHDTQGWRVQTIGCCLASLHATPMWLIALYVDGMAPVNAVWIPPQWICLSIIFIEIFTVFLPCWEVLRHQSLRKETLDAIAQWEAKTKGSGSEAKSISSISTVVDSMMSGWKSAHGSVSTTTSNRDSILTMGALEYVLQRNPAPLQQFSALHDFSGENIAFLTSVAEWKGSLPRPSPPASTKNATIDFLSPVDSSAHDKDRELVRERFNRALHIYAKFISVAHAEFPVNISSQDLRQLDAIFARPAGIMYGEEPSKVDPATPFGPPPGFGSFEPPPSPTATESSQKAFRCSVSIIGDRVQYWGEVPEEFDGNVFDAAEKSIKYLVLTNTWPKFIKSRRASSETVRSGDADVELGEMRADAGPGRDTPGL